MTWTEWLKVLISSVASAGAAGALVIFLSRTWIVTRLKASIEHEYARKLEGYKNELQQSVQREIAVRTAAQAAFSEGQRASMERKLAGIDKLWGEVLRLRNGLPTAVGMINILLVDEYSSLKNNPKFRTLLADITDEKLHAMSSELGLVESVRPYVGEYLWFVCFCYCAVMLRIALLLKMGRTDEEKLNWHTDSGTRQLIQAVFTQQEITPFDKAQFGKVKWLQDHFESKILKGIDEVISGEAFSSASFMHAREIQERIANIPEP